MSLSRRAFVRYGTTAAALAAVPAKMLWGAARPTSDVTHDAGQLDTLAVTIDPSVAQALALKAVEAARAAGATYADVRLTRTVKQLYGHRDDNVFGGSVEDTEELAVGVRALVNGYWGFVASPYWYPDEMTKLAKDAVAQAKTNARGTPRQVEWEPIPVATGSWVTPGVDPFSIPVEEKMDFVNAWRVGVLETPKGGKIVTRLQTSRLQFIRQERFMASTDGAATSQTFYSFMGEFPFAVGPTDWRAQRNGDGVGVSPKGLEYQRAGWDALLAAKIPEQIPVLFEQGAELLATPRKPVDIGRYDVVFDAASTGKLIAATFGIATQLDRALGYEANAGGTSYLGPDSLELLGTMKAAAPLITITGNRSLPGGGATVKWDDEGVVPEEFPLVQDGMLVDYQTTREQAAWLKPWYAKRNLPVRSHGCANAPSAIDITMQHTPNLTLAPATSSATFESLIAGIPKGLALVNGWVSTDFQAKNGTGRGLVREIVDGKLGKICEGAGYIFGTSELWNNVTAIGGASSAGTTSGSNYKGQPFQPHGYTVKAVPMAVRNMTIIDYRRRS